MKRLLISQDKNGEMHYSYQPYSREMDVERGKEIKIRNDKFKLKHDPNFLAKVGKKEQVR